MKRKQDAELKKNDEFWAELEQSEDPYDNLEGLAQMIHRNIGSTGVYIGELEFPHVKAADNAGDEDHLDKSGGDANRVITFKFANEDHKDLVCGTSIPPSQGICHEALKPNITAQNVERMSEKKSFVD